MNEQAKKKKKIKCASVTQLVECSICNQVVQSSSLCTSSNVNGDLNTCASKKSGYLIGWGNTDAHYLKG